MKLKLTDEQVDAIVSKTIKEEAILDRHLEKLRGHKDFSGLVDKVVEKYSSDKYRDKWYNRHIEPPEDLFWFLYFFAQRYGRECTMEEWQEYGNMFTSQLYYVNGYYFGRIDGQGSFVQITKSKQ